MFNKPLDIVMDNAIKQIKEWCNKNYDNAPKFSTCLEGVIMHHLKNHLKQSNNIYFNNWRNLNSLIKTKNLLINYNSQGITEIKFLPRYLSDKDAIEKLNEAITKALINNNGIIFKIEDKYVNLSSEEIIKKINNFKFN